MLGASKIYKVICSSFLQLSAISRDPLLHPVCRFVVVVERLADGTDERVFEESGRARTRMCAHYTKLLRITPSLRVAEATVVVPLRRNRVLSLSRSKVSVAEAAKVDIG